METWEDDDFCRSSYRKFLSNDLHKTKLYKERIVDTLNEVQNIQRDSQTTVSNDSLEIIRQETINDYELQILR